jgi:hypothetical protein
MAQASCWLAAVGSLFLALTLDQLPLLVGQQADNVLADFIGQLFQFLLCNREVLVLLIGHLNGHIDRGLDLLGLLARGQCFLPGRLLRGSLLLGVNIGDLFLWAARRARDQIVT